MTLTVSSVETKSFGTMRNSSIRARGIAVSCGPVAAWLASCGVDLMADARRSLRSCSVALAANTCTAPTMSSSAFTWMNSPKSSSNTISDIDEDNCSCSRICCCRWGRDAAETRKLCDSALLACTVSVISHRSAGCSLGTLASAAAPVLSVTCTLPCTPVVAS